MSTLEEVVGQLRASCDEMGRANGASMEAQRRLREALKLFAAAADGSGHDRPRELAHQVDQAWIAVGEAARGIAQGINATEDYIAEIAPAMAQDQGKVPPPPVTGEALLITRDRRTATGLLNASIKRADQIQDVTDYAVQRAREIVELRWPDDHGPAVPEVGTRLPNETPVVRAAHSSDSFTDAVGSVVITVAWLLAALGPAAKRLRQRLRG